MNHHRLFGVVAVLAVLVPWVTACEEDLATGAPVAETLVVSGGDNQEGVVGSTLGTPLQVTLTGSNGRPFAGATVRFRVVSKTGAVSPTDVTTDASGNASTTLTLGTIAERVQVQATVGSLNANFSATALADAPASLQAVGGDAQNGGTGTPLASVLEVRLRDANGNPVPGVEPTWSTPAGGSFVTVASDDAGVARAAWTLGPTGGVQTATASIAGTSVPFSANAFAPCGSAGAPAPVAHTIGTTSSSTMGDAGTSCVLATGEFAEFFEVSPASTSAGRFKVTTAAFDPIVRALTPGGVTFGIAPNFPFFTDNDSITVVIGGGSSVTFQVNPDAPNDGGGYSFVSADEGVDNNDGCVDGMWFLAPGSSTAQTITPTDCDFFGGFFSDWWSVYLEEGQTITLTHQGGTLDPWIVGFRPNGTAFYNNGCPGLGAAEVATYEATSTGIHLFDIGTCNSGAVGTYTLSYTIN